jgi:hypothetical protein
MKNSFIVLILLTALQLNAQITQPASKFLEIGFLFGLTNYSGDLSLQRVEVEETKPGYGAFVRRHFSNHFSAKAHFYTGSIAGDDSNTTRFDRKFRFSTNIVEFAMVGEWHLLGKERYSRTGVRKFFVTPYLFGGLGITFARAEAEYYGTIEKRATYIKDATEFGTTQKNRLLLAPIGLGLRADLFDLMSIGAEAGMRPVFSDKLDGVSVNANPKSGDWYYFAGVTLSFLIGTNHHR